MLAMSETEIIEVDEQLNPKIEWAEQNKELAEQLAMDATRLMSCTNERLEDYKDKGFFKRCASSFSGKTAKMQRDNQYDLVEMQKMGWRYLQMLNERDILMAHSLVTIKNNLETLAVKEDETREEIARFATKVKDRFNSHARRLDELEVAVDIQQWLTTIEVQDYDERYPKHMRLLCLVHDFRSKKADDWNMKNIQCLQQAIHNAKIDRKEKITLEQFVCNLIDEIDENSFEMFNEITTLNSYDTQKINTSFLVDEIASPAFNSLYQISDKYIHSDESVEALEDELNIGKKEAIKKIILRFIKKSGVDITKKIQLQDIALEILSCSKLAQELFKKSSPNIREPKNEIALERLNQTDDLDNKQIAEIEQLSTRQDLQLSLISKKFAVGNYFGVLISNDGLIKSFGTNINGCLGIGSNEILNCSIFSQTFHDYYREHYGNTDLDEILHQMSSGDSGFGGFGGSGFSGFGGFDSNNKREEYRKKQEQNSSIFFDVIDLPKNIKCISVDAGYRHALALFENGDVYAWGYSASGQLGDDTNEDRLSPFKVIGLPKDIKPVKIIAGAWSSVVLLETGDLYITGQIVNSLVFVPYSLDFKVKDVELLYDESDQGIVLVKNDNSIIVRKANEYSNLDWCNYDDNDMYQLKGLHGDAIVKKIIAGSDYLFVLTQNNTLYGIGQNKDGQLGLNSHSNTIKSFSKVYGIEGEIRQVATSKAKSDFGNNDEKHFTLIMTDSYLYGCGTNAKFQLGKQDNYYGTSCEKDKSYAKNMAIGASVGVFGGFIGSGIGAIVGAGKTAIEDTEYEYTKHYAEIKPKNIEESFNVPNMADNIEIACGNDASYMYNYTTSQFYKLGDSYKYSGIGIYNIL